MRLRIFLASYLSPILNRLIGAMSSKIPPIEAPKTQPGTSFHENAAPTYAMYENLKDLCHNNIEHFKNDESDNGQRLKEAFLSLISNIDVIWPVVDLIRKEAPKYDFDENTPGNGYRSFVTIVDSCILHSVKLGRQICIARDSIIFRKLHYTKEVEACSQLLASLGSCLNSVQELLNDDGELLKSGKFSPHEMFASAANINQYCFYGRCLGFQYLPSIRGILKGVSIVMAGFSEAYYGRNHFINSVWAGGRFMMDPELRARRIVNISHHATIDFCKAFWFLSETEIMHKLPTLVSSSVAVNRLILIPPEPLELQNTDGRTISIPIPNAHIGTQVLHVRLISKIKREGMVGEGSGGKPPARGIIFHCHGGGFVAQSSRSHEVYLREWAYHLDVPILSIDYNLAPQAPYPRALQDIFYAYCWVLKNSHLLGTTGERIVLAGDSAGANLNLALTQRLIMEKIRKPDGIFMAYTPVNVNFVPSPSRLLCLMDPLLPFGFMMRCLKAYVCPPPCENGKLGSRSSNLNGSVSMDKDFLRPSPSQEGPNGMLGVSDVSSYEEVSESDLVELQAHKSLTSDHLSDTLSGASLSSEHRTLVSPNNEDPSQHVVSDFLDKYVLESDTDSEGHKVPVIKKKSLELNTESPESATLTDGKGFLDEKSSIDDASTLEDRSSKLGNSKSIHQRITKAAGSLVGTVSTKLSNLTLSSTSKVDKKDSLGEEINPSSLDDLIADNSPVDEFTFTVPLDPLISPYLASDEVLKRFPPVKIMTINLDPCLDDCVSYGKKLKRLGTPVTMDILEGLPHGFLNFSRICKEAHEGSLLAILRIRELFDFDSLPKK